MKNVVSKYVIFFPAAVFLLICLVEWGLWVWTPYSYFYSRGVHFPNVDYVATTYGNLVSEDIFISKYPRKSRYVTDQYGARNLNMPSNTDILIIGESFGAGGGTSHENTPAIQLSKQTGLSVVTSPIEYGLSYGNNIIENAVYVIKHSKPVLPRVILLIYVDNFLWDWNQDIDYELEIKKVINAKSQKKLFLKDLKEYFIRFKKHISDNSPVTILSRKFKSFIKVSFKNILNYFSLYTPNNKKNYFESNGEIIGFAPLPGDLSEINIGAQGKLKNIASAHKYLYQFGLKNNILVIALIVPFKYLAYYNKINNVNYYSNYPGVMFEKILQSMSIPTVSVYSEFIAATNYEIEHNGAPVYWRDDTHWNDYGINLSMRKVKGKLIDLNVLQ